jgi:hypothetical protein
VSNAGGVGFYIKTSVAFNKREDLCTSDNEHESLWIEIESNHQHNIICGVVYRHPNANLNMTLKYIYSIIEKIHNENKYCIMMGDFNINLVGNVYFYSTKLGFFKLKSMKLSHSIYKNLSLFCFFSHSKPPILVPAGRLVPSPLCTLLISVTSPSETRARGLAQNVF